VFSLSRLGITHKGTPYNYYVTIVIVTVLFVFEAFGFTILPVSDTYAQNFSCPAMLTVTIYGNGSVVTTYAGNASIAPYSPVENVNGDNRTYRLLYDTCASIVVYKNNTILEGEGHSIINSSIFLINVVNVSVTGFKINWSTVVGGDTASIYIIGSSNIVVENNILNIFPDHGIKIYNSNPSINPFNITVRNNILNGIPNADRSGVLVLNEYGGGDFRGIYIENNTIVNTTYGGIAIEGSTSGIVVKNNKVINTVVLSGIDVIGAYNASVESNVADGILIQSSSHVTVNSNIVTSQYDEPSNFSQIGIINSTDVLVVNNSVNNNIISTLYIGYGSDNITVLHNNFTANNGYAVIVNSTGRIRLHYNSLYSGLKDGILSLVVTPDVNATLNWWGDVSGPSGVGYGSGSSVSYGILYKPWLNGPPPCGRPLYSIWEDRGSVFLSTYHNITVLNSTGYGGLLITASGNGGLESSAMQYCCNPIGCPNPISPGSPGSIVLGYYDIHINSSSTVSNLIIRIYYKKTSSADESKMKIYWWNNISGSWLEASSYRVNITNQLGYDGYVELDVNTSTSPNLNQLEGTPIVILSPRVVTGNSTTVGGYLLLNNSPSDPYELLGSIILTITIIVFLIFTVRRK